MSTVCYPNSEVMTQFVSTDDAARTAKTSESTETDRRYTGGIRLLVGVTPNLQRQRKIWKLSTFCPIYTAPTPRAATRPSCGIGVRGVRWSLDQTRNCLHAEHLQLPNVLPAAVLSCRGE